MVNDARFVLDNVCDDHPGVSKNLSADAAIVHDHPFGNAIVKLMDWNDSQLTATE